MIKRRLFFLSLSLMLTIGWTCGAWSQEFGNTRKTFFVSKGNSNFCVRFDFDIPMNKPHIEHLLYKQMFKEDFEDLSAVQTNFLTQFPSIKSKVHYMDQKIYSDGGHVYVKATYHGINHIYSLADESKEYRYTINSLAGKYIPYAYSIKKEARKLKNIKIDEMEGMFTYDTEAGRLLNATDVFTAEAIKKLNIRNAPENTEILIYPKYCNVDYVAEENGVKSTKTVLFKNNAEFFTDKFRTTFAKLDSCNQQIKIIEERKRITDDENRMRIESSRYKTYGKTTYQSESVDMSQLYLYMWDDVCYVSGINKDIMDMTDEEIDQLANIKGCEYIGADIRDAKEFIKNGGDTGGRLYHIGDHSYEKNGNAYPMNMCDYEAIPPVPLEKFMTKVSLVSVFGGTSYIRYVVDCNGNIRMPIIVIPNDNAYKTKSAKLDKLHVMRLRKLGKWIPAMKDGKHVNVVISANLSAI